MKNDKYKYIDDPEPQKRPETGEDKFLRIAKKIFNTVVYTVFSAMVLMFICGVVMRHM